MNTQTKERKKSQKYKNSGWLVILGILFVILLLLTSGGFNLFRTLFNSVKAKQLLSEEIKYSTLVPAVFQYYSEQRAAQRVEKGEALSGVSEPDIPLLMSFMQLEDWNKIKNLLIEDEFIDHLVSVSVDGLYAWIDSAEVYPIIQWNMSPLKDALVGEPGKASIMIGYEALPECTKEEIADFTARLSAMPPGVEVLYNLCRFPEPWKVDQIDDYEHALVDVNNNIPLEFSFSDMLAKSSPGSGAWMPFIKNLLRTIRWFGQWGWLPLFVTTGLIVLLTYKFPRRILKNFGLLLTVCGGILALDWLLSSFLIFKWLTRLLLSQSSELVRGELSASLQHLAINMNRTLLVETIINLLLGIGMLVVPFLIKQKKLPQEIPGERTN